MKFMQNNNQTKPIIEKTNVRYVEAEAYYDGAHDIPIEDSLAETKAGFQQLREQTERESKDDIKRLEGELGTVQHFRGDADGRWQMFRDETEGKMPGFFIPLLAILFALLAVPSESWFLAPVLQGWNINEEIPQLIVATIFVFTLGVLLKTALTCYEKTGRENSSWRDWFNAGTILIFTLALAIYLGIFRADALAHEAKMNSELGSFLNESVGVNIALSILITIGLPLAAALALSFGFDRLRYWQQWRKARKDALKFAKQQEETEKKLEAETEKLDKRIAEIEATCDEWLSAQRQAHAEGRKIKATRRPLWEVSLLLAGGAILITSLVMAIVYIFFDASLAGVVQSDTARFALYLGFAAGLTALFSYVVLKSWNSPSPRQLYAKRTVIWHEDEKAPLSLKTTKPSVNILTESGIKSELPEKASSNGNFAKVN